MNLYIYSDESGVFDYVHRVILSIISSEKFQKNVAKMAGFVYNNDNRSRRASEFGFAEFMQKYDGPFAF